MEFRVWDKKNRRFDTEPFWNMSLDGRLRTGMGIHPTEEDRYVVSWFTGRQDKNGRKIYGDDIVQNDDSRCGIVTWFDSLAGFVIVSPDRTFPEKTDLFAVYDGWQIIGNMYENPELAEGVVNAAS